jgi:hypothetical protein
MGNRLSINVPTSQEADTFVQQIARISMSSSRKFLLENHLAHFEIAGTLSTTGT